MPHAQWAAVHSRGRGDGPQKYGKSDFPHGSPPRARGRPVPAHGAGRAARFTPAGAGTAQRVRLCLRCTTVHPRGRGDGAVLAAKGTYTSGSPPRARGRRGCQAWRLPPYGSPPRARGRLALVAGAGQEGRFTPAGAGTARPPACRPCARAVHPRGRGDGSPTRTPVSIRNGSPPRARGRLLLGLRGLVGVRFTPAGAGTASRRPHPSRPRPVHPRGRGDGAPAGPDGTRKRGSPPRARGRRSCRWRTATWGRFTPAGAGTAWRSPRRARGSPVHPRGRGDGGRSPDDRAVTIGSPPRARGRRPGMPRAARPSRFTPAGAGTAVSGLESPAAPTVHPRGRGDGRAGAPPVVM